MKIHLTFDGKVLAATLLDNATARDLVSLLPLELTLEDYASTEKIAHPPRKLSIAGAPAGAGAEVGDIAYYAPWGKPGDLLPRLRLLARAREAGAHRRRYPGARRAGLFEGAGGAG